MKKRLRAKRLWSSIAGCLVVGALAFGAMAIFTEVEAAPRCICPMVYAPVICDHGKVYSNLCVANCRHAKNCVPLIILPPPI